MKGFETQDSINLSRGWVSGAIPSILHFSALCVALAIPNSRAEQTAKIVSQGLPESHVNSSVT